MKKNILFLCTGNSCRSQMAEGLGRELKGDEYNFYSAGIETHGINPHAQKVMKEIGIDISSHRSQLLSEFDDVKFDFVFTVCGHAHETCPLFPRDAKIIHTGFDDPPKLSLGLEGEEFFKPFRRVRDEIKEMVLHIEDYMKE